MNFEWGKKALKESINKVKKVTKHVLTDVYFNKVYQYTRLINDYLQKFILHNR